MRTKRKSPKSGVGLRRSRRLPEESAILAGQVGVIHSR